MKIYVAGKTRNYEKVREVQALVDESGHMVTYDWTRSVPDGAWENEANANLSPEFKRVCARNDMMGVAAADAIIAVMSDDLWGTMIEIGMAMMAAKEIVLLGHPERESVFFHLPKVTVVIDDEALHRWLLQNG